MRPRATALRWLAALTCAGMFVVLVMGAAVTNTGSAEGCGRSWPLCNGQLVPEFTVSTAIEYSHRAVTGVEGVLVVALTAAMLILWRRDGEPVVLALLMLTTLLLQAGLGAGAVLWPQSALLLATHFGVSLAAFAATFLSAVVVFERTASAPLISPAASRLWPGWTPTRMPWLGWIAEPWSWLSRAPAARPWLGSATARRVVSRPLPPFLPGRSTTPQETPLSEARTGADWRTGARTPWPGSKWRTAPPTASAPVPASVRRWAVAVGLYVLGVVYLGAYVRHAGVSLACADWPLCNGQLVPLLGGPAAVAFAHRLAALGAVLLLAWLSRLAVRYGVAQLAALLAFGLGVLQALSGALVVWTRLDLFATLAHAAIMALLFACLANVVRRAAALPTRNDSVPDVFSPSDDKARNLLPAEAVSFPHVLSTTTSGSGAAGLHRAVADDAERQRAIAERAWRVPADEQRRAQGRPER